MQRRKNKESLTSFLYSKSITRGIDLSQLKGLSVVFNTESVYHFYLNKDYREYVLRCKNVFIDGAMLVFGARLIGWKLNRYHGPDLLTDLEEQGICKNSVLIGGSSSNHVLEKNSVVKKWIKLPYTKNMNLLFDDTVSQINCDYEVCMVSLGLPKQELLSSLLANSKKFDKKTLFLPLGAAIDFRTGLRQRSSLFWQRLGLEWLPRMIREPRMVKRIYFSLVGFILLLGKR